MSTVVDVDDVRTASASRAATKVRLAGLDGLRGLAVLAVVLFHARALPFGWVGVDLFFGLSGFLITTILLDAGVAGAPLRATLRPFYIRRALRILPLAWAVVLVVAAASGRWAGSLWYASFVVNWHPWPPAPRVLAHYWTLAVEEQFYLLWPLFVLRASRRVVAAACLSIPILDSIGRAVLYLGGWSFATEHVLGNATIARADPLALGALLAILYVSRRRVSARVLWLLASCAGAAVALLFAAETFAHRLEAARYILQPLLLAVLVGCTLQAVIQTPPRWLSMRALAWLGTVSYGVYVLHGVMSPWFVNHVASVSLRAIGLLGVSCVLAAASWYGFEKPIGDQKRRWPMPPAGAARPGDRASLPAAERPSLSRTPVLAARGERVIPLVVALETEPVRPVDDATPPTPPDVPRAPPIGDRPASEAERREGL